MKKSIKKVKVGEFIRPDYWPSFHRILSIKWHDETLKTVLEIQLCDVSHVCCFCFYEDVE